MNYESVLKLLFAISCGWSLGAVVSTCVVTGFAAMILNPVFNVYYAVIFFIVGSGYTYKFLKKNRIQLSLGDTDFVQSTKENLPFKFFNEPPKRG